jgi:hypothetical protein
MDEEIREFESSLETSRAELGGRGDQDSDVRVLR